MSDDTADFFQFAGAREYWTGYDIDRKLELAIIDDHEWIPEETREQIRDWAKTKTPPSEQKNDTQVTPYKPITDKYEIRVLEVKPGKRGDKLRGSLHHCSLEYIDPIPSNRTYFRMRYALSMNDLTTPVSYTALSYTWGPPVFDADFECDGHQKKITKSLESALLHFRREDRSVVMWIDQICIDQSNNEEKSQQIPLMSRIYERALNTAIWMGDTSDGSDAAVKLLDDINIRLQFTTEDDIDTEEFERLRLPKPESEEWKALWDFLSRPWFTRVWIIQEVILSRDPWVVCGDSIMVWENLAGACMQLRTTGISEWMQQNFPKEKKDEDRDVCQLAWELDQLKQHAQDNNSTLFSLLVQSRGAQCYDLRDKVYGLLGVCNAEHQEALKVSYDEDFTASRLYHDVVVHHLSLDARSWSLHELLSCVDHESPHLPSWVPDWSKPRRTVALGYTTASQGIYRAHGRFVPLMLKIDAEVDDKNHGELHVRGVLVDSIAKLSDVFEDPDLTYEYPSTNKTLLDFLDFVSQMTEYPAPHSVFSAFWHTLVAGKDGAGRLKCPDSVEEIVSLLLDASTGQSPSIAGQTYTTRQKRPKGKGRLELERLKVRKSGSAGEAFQETRTAMINAVKNRRLGITTKGYLGLFPQHAEAGDNLYVLDGGHVPFVMRDAEGGKFRLVGECYVYGIMDGEAIREDTRLEEMTLV
ncbi:heterokaryon incompatibility protein [Colletotrichum karsti]|uniref:Heterokaryon incompatibility protein n=1 Tax=Colletotrichum karsti TaxID=1095194 RepID=A0A9P6IEF1_9PEZI|nr:heterokaryon incompatibility protein [Colletotrichum karsti]KAF9880376.1 heterokaryon incompatibility protein [Colletotrichum karsti]